MTALNVIFSHGQESGPWGTKIRAMADRVRELGHVADSIDYQAVADAVREYAAENPAALLETMITGLADMILARFEVTWVRIKMDKGAVLDGVANVGVIIERGELSG